MTTKEVESAVKSASPDDVVHIDQFGRKYSFRVFVYAYTVGKEELCVDLAKAYRTKVVLDPDRYEMIRRTNFYPEIFTKNPGEGFIHLTKHFNYASRERGEAAIHITLTGWINCKHYMCLKKGEYQVPYSSHSNYPELDEFIALVRPSVIKNIVIEDKKDTDIDPDGIDSLRTYKFWLSHFKQRGMDLLSELTRRDVRGSV
jgi:hypothetical protein